MNVWERRDPYLLFVSLPVSFPLPFPPPFPFPLPPPCWFVAAFCTAAVNAWPAMVVTEPTVPVASVTTSVPPTAETCTMGVLATSVVCSVEGRTTRRNGELDTHW